MSRRVATVFPIFMESRESCSAADGRAWKVDGRAQALVGPGLATPLMVRQTDRQKEGFSALHSGKITNQKSYMVATSFYS